jgi:hypothetical protein
MATDTSSDFANPYLACEKCGRKVTSRPWGRNQPCGHTASFESVCPSWSPVDGCRCQENLIGPPCKEPA